MVGQQFVYPGLIHTFPATVAFESVITCSSLEQNIVKSQGFRDHLLLGMGSNHEKGGSVSLTFSFGFGENTWGWSSYFVQGIISDSKVIFFATGAFNISRGKVVYPDLSISIKRAEFLVTFHRKKKTQTKSNMVFRDPELWAGPITNNHTFGGALRMCIHALVNRLWDDTTHFWNDTHQPT